jgi:hypothetical protein
MADFTKYAYEERWRYYEFQRDDGKDGLATGETIATHAVAIADANGADCTTAMISSTSVVDDTRVAYLLKAGVAGQTYTLTVTAVTSEGQKLKGVVEISVV